MSHETPLVTNKITVEQIDQGVKELYPVNRTKVSKDMAQLVFSHPDVNVTPVLTARTQDGGIAFLGEGFSHITNPEDRIEESEQ